MRTDKDIVLVVDYHAENIEFRWLNLATGEERTGKYATSKASILRLVEQAVEEAAAVGGKVIWLMESTTGWARVKDLIGARVEFVLVNVLQLPLPPKARRRKSDKLDTARILREYLHSTSFPTSYQPTAWFRQVRRLVDSREDLVRRQTAIKNWISSFLHQESWEDRENLWSAKGLARLEAMAMPATDRLVMRMKLEQLKQLSGWVEQVESAMQEVYKDWPEAQWLDEIRGIGMVTAVSVLAHIGDIRRFKTADALIAYAGLAPGYRQSDKTVHHGRIGGGGTDSHLRYLLIEATPWLREIPRYQAAYERAVARKGKKVARIVLARMLLRSIHKMLTDRVRFRQFRAA